MTSPEDAVAEDAVADFPPARPYAGSVAHLLAELGRLDGLLRQRIDEVQAGRKDPLALSEPEVDRPGPDPPPPDRLDRGEEITGRVLASLHAGLHLRLVALAQLFELSPFDVDVVVACLAPEMDGRYEHLYAYLHDDPTRGAPTVGLLMDVLCADLDARLEARIRLSAAAPLLRHQIVALEEPADRRSTTLLARIVRLDARITRFLLEDDTPDEGLRATCRFSVPTCGVDELVLPPEVLARLAVLAARPDPDLLLYLCGGAGVGKRTAAAALCAAWGAALLVVDGPRLAQRSAEDFAALLGRIAREARLQGAVLYWDGADGLLREEWTAHRELLLTVLTAHPGPAFLAGSAAWEPPRTPGGATVSQLELPAPGYAERIRLWTAALAGSLPTAEPEQEQPALPGVDVDLAELAGRFRLSGGQIRGAVATARSLAAARGAVEPTGTDLHEASRLQSTRTLDALARRIIPGHGWDDLVLPADRMAQLREIVDQVRYRAVVHEAWGFEQRGGNGLNVLFTGPSGTGKTMAAGVLAHTLGLDLYKIDLSTVVSKFIGETEKNLARIFDEAAAGNVVLFFDEADALFGRRTQVKDSHDRYANLEISYLLQKLEEHDGVVVLATNLRKNMDDAFVRRLHATVEFPVPEVTERLRIWQQVWPAAAPRDSGLDFELLAREVDLTGGNIRNIAVAGAFLAAADGGVVTMAHLVAATRREYQKMGKVLTAGELGAR